MSPHLHQGFVYALTVVLCVSLIACDGSKPTDVSSPDRTSETGPTVGTGNGSLTVVFPDYLTKIRYGSPFGIVLLESLTQPNTFTHPELPIADWEWFWFGDDLGADPEKQLKLIQPVWHPLSWLKRQIALPYHSPATSL